MAVGALKIGEVVRCAIGGTFMGLANLVPGISGGTMLLATGVYRKFVDAIADFSSFRLRWPLIFTLLAIGVPAALSILIFAGLFRDLVLAYRWVMYSIFIGLTLGGVPVILSQIKKFDPKLLMPIACGVLAMGLTAIINPGDPSANVSTLMLVVGGILGASAMVLPGISGGYILLVLGQYVAILSGIDQLKIGLKAQDQMAILAGLKICIPVGIGVVCGIVAVSHLVRYFFKKHENGTYGVLLGLLVGAVFGLWPFQAPVAPKIGDVIRGTVLETQALVDAVDAKYFSMAHFTPDIWQIGMSIVLIVAGFALTFGIDRLGKRLEHNQTKNSAG